MHRAGDPSWRFASDVGQLSHAALYVRDAFRLSVTTAPLLPPRLTSGVPEQADVLAHAKRDQAGMEWGQWWVSIIDHSARLELGGDPASIRRLVVEQSRLSDHPDWRSLDDRPALQSMVRATFDDAIRWVDSQPDFERARAGPDGPFPWPLVKSTAEQVAAEENVSLGALNGCAIVLLVDGLWWEVVRPGAVVCSLEAGREKATATEVVRRAFMSAL